jgi:hypothetical protein
VTTPYTYLVAAANTPAADLVDDLCLWHDRMVAHLRRHGAAAVRDACACRDAEDCPRAQAVDLWRRAHRTFGSAAASLTFLRAHGGDDA